MDKNKNKSTWKDQLLFNIPLIDEQHAGFFSLVNKMINFYEDKPDLLKENINEVLNELENYLLLHFDYEEELMKEAGYDNIEQHVSEHLHFISKIKEYKLEYSFDSAYLFEKVTEFMKKWFLGHIIQTDLLYKHNVKKIFKK